MLALKTMTMPSLAARHEMHPQLPVEVLDNIAEHLYESSYYQVDVLLAFSLVSQQFRKSALTFLFGTVTHVVRDRWNHCQRGQLQSLQRHPQLLSYVHTLHILRPLGKQEYEVDDTENFTVTQAHERTLLDLQVLRESLPLLQRLRRIRYARSKQE